MPDAVLEWMKKNDVPLTREAYIDVAFMGDGLPEGYDEDDLPPEVREKTDQ